MRAGSIQTNTCFTSLNTNKKGWCEEFNQATFFNFDLLHPVTVNRQFKIPPASAHPVTGDPVPAFLEISLNKDEVNKSSFDFDFGGSTTANLLIVHTEYYGNQK